MNTFRNFARVALAASICAASSQPAEAWNAHGHRTITYLALAGLPPEMPAYLRETTIAARIAEQSNEPDRWRGTRRTPIQHEANPEHYINAEDLSNFGLSLRTLPPHRYEYLRAMAIARELHPDRFSPIDEARNEDKSREWPGFLPWAIAEHHAKLQASFHTFRILEAISDPARAAELEQARSNIIYHMGVLSHFVGDAAQPLHTTIHHHGWVGDNPGRYTTEYGFHSYIDGRILEIHDLSYDTLRPRIEYIEIEASDPWPGVLEYIERSLREVEPLYKLQESGDLERDPGEAFIAQRLNDAGATLAALYRAAWVASEPADRDIAAFLRFAGRPTPTPDLQPHSTSAPAGSAPPR